MINIMIHCTRQQVALLGACSNIGKIHLNPDGTKTIVVPEWIHKMYQAAKAYEYIIAYGHIDDKAVPRMRTYHSHPQPIKENRK